ncbi:hypothetical protein JOB18_042028 [Solea senegalensis]|uniref:Uncharacterized protein n=1 Tax=Solea senegalensis TaxID=28829 RepID=A0AAV6PVV2_SOLSE|nr:hypothetical protein JOB18_042028 [Solea senegalensis]
MVSTRGTFSLLLCVACVTLGFKLPELPSPDVNISDFLLGDKKSIFPITNLSIFFDVLKSVTDKDPRFPMADLDEMMCNCTFLLEKIHLMKNSSVNKLKTVS